MRFVKAAALVAAGLSILLGGSSAQAAVAPDFDVFQAHAFRSLSVHGDLFFLVRYELPLFTPLGDDAWCAELEDADGCAEVPPAPTVPTSLPEGSVYLTFLTEWDGLDGDLQDLVPVPRVDHALGGIYFGPGHGFTWGDTAARVCVESSPDYFDAQARACMTPRWEGAASPTTITTRAALGPEIVATMLNLEHNRRYPQGTLVTSAGKVTVAGRVFALEALGTMDRLIPESFQAAGGPVILAGYTPVSGDTVLQGALRATATRTTVYQSLEIVGRAHFGLSGTTLALLGGAISGMIFAIIVYRGSGNGPLAGMAFAFPMIVGVWIGAPTLAIILSVVTVLLIPTVAIVIRRLP